MNILITGSNGYLGSVLVKKILQAASEFDHDCIGKLAKWDVSLFSHKLKLDNLFAYDNLMYHQVTLTEHCYRNNFHFINGDVRDHKKLKQYIEIADVIIPLAAIVGFPACDKDPILAKQVNFEHIKFIVDNCKHNQLIVYPNTNSGYGIGQENQFCTEETLLNPISIYGRTKCESEQYILNYGNCVILRLATVFGVSNRMRLDLLVNDFVYKAVTDRYLVLFEKDFKRNYIHIQDVALTFIYAINKLSKLELDFPVFNVGLSSANLSKLELAKEIRKFIPSLVIKTEDFKHDPDQRNYIVSNKKLEDTGWQPYYNIPDGIQELIKAYEIIVPSNRNFTNL